MSKIRPLTLSLKRSPGRIQINQVRHSSGPRHRLRTHVHLPHTRVHTHRTRAHTGPSVILHGPSPATSGSNRVKSGRRVPPTIYTGGMLGVFGRYTWGLGVFGRYAWGFTSSPAHPTVILYPRCTVLSPSPLPLFCCSFPYPPLSPVKLDLIYYLYW